MNARVLGAALLALTLSAGCSSEAEESQSLPPVSAAPSPTPSAVAAVPPSAQAQTPQGAAEFARFFYAEVGRAFAKRDPEVIRRLSAPGCEACGLFVRSLTKLRDNNERASDVVFDIVAAEAPGFEGDEARVDVIYNTADLQRFDSSGKVIYKEAAVQGGEVQITLVRSRTGWLVREIRGT